MNILNDFFLETGTIITEIINSVLDRIDQSSFQSTLVLIALICGIVLFILISMGYLVSLNVSYRQLSETLMYLVPSEVNRSKENLIRLQAALKLDLSNNEFIQQVSGLDDRERRQVKVEDSSNGNKVKRLAYEISVSLVYLLGIRVYLMA